MCNFGPLGNTVKSVWYVHMCDDKDDNDNGDYKLQGCPDFLGVPDPAYSLGFIGLELSM